MPPESIVLLLIGTWLLVAAAMLWGMLRIARRHHRPAPTQRPGLLAVGTRLLANKTVTQTAVSRVPQPADAYGKRTIRRLQ